MCSIFRLKSTIKLPVSSLTLLRLLSLCLTRHFLTSYINWSSHQICFSAYPIICQTEPLLFLLYVNDIPNIPFSKDSRLIVYTDDLLLLKPISCQKDLLTFQCDVNLISQWTLQNQLSLNCNKTKYTFISSCNNFNFPIHVNSNQIERFIAPNTMGSRFVMTLLGLSILRVSVMDRRDYWATSSEDFLHTAPRIPFFMYTRLRCYPFWSMHACIVWDPHHKKDQLLLEKVQLFAARLATKSDIPGLPASMLTSHH